MLLSVKRWFICYLYTVNDLSLELVLASLVSSFLPLTLAPRASAVLHGFSLIFFGQFASISEIRGKVFLNSKRLFLKGFFTTEITKSTEKNL